MLSHLRELPIQRAFKRQQKHLQRSYNDFKSEWLKKHDMQRTTLSQVGKVLEKSNKFVGLDEVRDTLQKDAKTKRELKVPSSI